MIDELLEVKMKYTGEMTSYFPERVDCLFSYENQQKIITINGLRLRYMPDIIKQFVNEQISLRMSNNSINMQSKEEKKKNYYESLLELSSEYDEEMLLTARKSKLADYHPDYWEREGNETINKNANQFTREVLDAYDYLLKELRRTKNL